MDDQVNVSNDYDFVPLDSDGDARPRPHQVTKGSLNVVVLWYREHFSNLPLFS